MAKSKTPAEPEGVPAVSLPPTSIDATVLHAALESGKSAEEAIALARATAPAEDPAPAPTTEPDTLTDPVE